MQYKNIKIKKRTDGRWYARFKKENKIYYVYDRNQTNCYNKLKQKYKEVEKNLIVPTSITLKEWIKKWLELYKINKNRESTLKTFDYTYKNHFANSKLITKKLQDIKNYDIQEFLNNIVYPKIRLRSYEYLKDIFTKALNNELIKKSPMDNVEKPKYEKQKLNKALSIEEQKRFIIESKNSRLQDVYLVILYQGLRKGEALALKRNDIDFDNNKLIINESYTTHTTKDKDTKNKSSNRVMPLFEKTKKILLKYQDLKPEEELFKTNTHTLHTEFKKILINANLPDITIHELRHTFITRCKEAGIIENVVQLWCGHQLGSKMTSQVYTHINEDYNNTCIIKLNNFDTPFDTL